MSSKKWLYMLFLLLLCCITFLGVFNYTVDPAGYFALAKGKTYIPQNGYTRYVKTKYLLEHKRYFNAIILGGSKSACLNTKLLGEMSGLKYYNLWNNYGTFSDYLLWTKFFIKHMQLKEILLHISSIEAGYFDAYEHGDLYVIPSIMKEENSFIDGVQEAIKFLFWNPVEGYKLINDTLKRKLFINLATGEIDYSPTYAQIEENPSGYIDKIVLRKYRSHIDDLFSKKPNIPAVKANVEALRQIKSICDKNNVRLKVIIGPTFLTERRLFECEDYLNSIQDMVKITDIWDCSNFSIYNQNPINFINDGHYNNKVADEIIKALYGKSKFSDLCVLLTKANIEQYLYDRKKNYETLYKNYKQTGNINLCLSLGRID